jgi:hypothetical protein
MRNLGEIMHPGCKISLFSFNQKFIVKFEQGLVEQTLKFEHLEFDRGEVELRERLNETFISKVIESFKNLHEVRETFLS